MNMRKISVSDITIKMTDLSPEGALSFRKKIEVSKLLDRLGVSVIETGPLASGKKDPLLVKSLASAVSNSALAVPVDISNIESINRTWESLKFALKPRLQICAPVSTVQMEYHYHLKPDALLSLVSSFVSECRGICPDVEFIADDFTRADYVFLGEVITAAVSSGATQITVHDVAGNLLHEEFSHLLSSIRAMLPDNVRMGVWCSNEMYLAESDAISAILSGADEIKVQSYGKSTVNIKRFAHILDQQSDKLQASSDMKLTETDRISSYIKLLCTGKPNATVSNLSSIQEDISEWRFSSSDSFDTIRGVVEKLGYDLNQDDSHRVYAAFMRLASRNEFVNVKELEAIIASVAYQAPPTYVLDNYIVTSCNMMSSSCHLRIKKGEDVLENMCMGDGPVDAAFQAIEKLIEKHYELDDFQIRSVTEGREALGSAVVRLRYDGKLYSGLGISTDIVGSSIMAYLSAVNKIAYEEEAES